MITMSGTVEVALDLGDWAYEHHVRLWRHDAC